MSHQILGPVDFKKSTLDLTGLCILAFTRDRKMLHIDPTMKVTSSQDKKNRILSKKEPAPLSVNLWVKDEREGEDSREFEVILKLPKNKSDELESLTWTDPRTKVDCVSPKGWFHVWKFTGPGYGLKHVFCLEPEVMLNTHLNDASVDKFSWSSELTRLRIRLAMVKCDNKSTVQEQDMAQREFDVARQQSKMAYIEGIVRGYLSHLH